MSSEPRRPRFVLGPGTVLALLLAGFLLWRNGGRPWWREPPAPPAAPVALPELGLTPEVAWLLRHAEALALSDHQTASLAALQAGWERASQGDLTAAEAGAERLEGYLAADRPSVAGAQRASDELSTASANLAALRQAYWDDAWSELTATQRERVRALRRAAPHEMR